LSEIKTEDMDAFDPNLHEAMIAEDRDDLESDAVLQVLQKGYRLGSELIRPVRVRVGKAIHENGEEQ
jgi:molecular chaperone GrpE